MTAGASRVVVAVSLTVALCTVVGLARAGLVTSSTDLLPPFTRDGALRFTEPLHMSVVRSPPDAAAPSAVKDTGVQVPIRIDFEHSAPLARAAVVDTPSCCFDGASRRPTANLSFHFSPSPPVSPLGDWIGDVELTAPVGTHVVTGTAACVDGSVCGSDHVLFDAVPASMEAFVPYTQQPLPDATPAVPRTDVADALVCYYGSLNKVDGIKMAWIQQWQHLGARGWPLRYISATDYHHPVLVEQLAAVGADVLDASFPTVPESIPMHLVMQYAELLVDTLHSYNYNLAALEAAAAQRVAGVVSPDGSVAMPQLDGVGMAWVAQCWRGLQTSMAGCSVVVHANGDKGDRLIVEGAKLAGARAVVGELSGLVFEPMNHGSPSVYVGPSSYAVDLARKAFAATAPNNGALSHVNSLALTAGGNSPPVVETLDDFAARTAVIHLGVNLTRFTLPNARQTRNRRRSPTAPKVIGFVGRLSSEKSIGLVVRAMPLVLEAVPSATLRLCGTGFLRPYLEEVVADLGITDSVEFMGFVRQDDLKAAMADMDVMVFPSLRVTAETFALVNVESMAMELPVVSFGVPGTLDYFVHQENALIAPSVTVEALAEQIVYLLQNPGQATLLGIAARETVEHAYPTDVSSTSYELLYDCLRRCTAVHDLPCARRCAQKVTHSERR